MRDLIYGLRTPGAGCIEYCTDNIYNGRCAYDSDLTDYTECEADQTYPFLIDCNGVHGSSVKPNTCKCIDGYTPTGCTCPRNIDLNQLDGVPPGQCECLDEDDLRAMIRCPLSRYCSNEDLQSTPYSDENQGYSKSQCQAVITLDNIKDCNSSHITPVRAPIKQGKHAVNINISLDKINKTIYTNKFDLYESIMILLNNLKDPHAILTPPCVSKQTYALDTINIFVQKFYDINTYVDVEETYPTLEAIARWVDEEVSISRNPITRLNYALMEYKINKLLIDLRVNGGGQVRLGRELLNFLFPNVEHLPDEAQQPLELDDMGIDKLFNSKGNRKRTTQSKDKKSIKTVNLTYKYMNYMGNYDTIAEYLKNQNIARKILYQPQNVLIVTDGACASTCSQFVKHIGEKHLGRIVGVGAPYPVDKDIRFDVGMATSGSVYNYKQVQEININASPPLSQEDKSKLPNKFYRIGTDILWSNKGGYGFTDETSDQLLEYKIVDADFRVEYFQFDSLISDDDDDVKRFVMYNQVLKREKELLDPNKCLSWEVETSNTQTPNNCKGCLRNDPYSIYVGYYRNNYVIGQKINQKCSLVPLGPNQNRSEIAPDQTEDEVKDNDPCNLHVIVDEQVEQEEGEEEQQQSDQDKQKEIETEEPKSKAEMISGIVVAGVIVVASIVAMIIVAVVIQHQKYSGLGRRGQQLISVDA
ncbi:MAG: hypothetical protein EZS28_012522 [Streblomastix strix]|uniref:Tail specific protease domain-containing protein n=1 Tax=Streblomastix strix TaxID=222440 RepID=A0A5J4WAK9_9EUKA|nr:MAG: hypothetical protein EZS28_012522 [Streblomastix strix]